MKHPARQVQEEKEQTFEELPAYLSAYWNREKADKEPLLAAASSDMRKDGRYGEVWAVATRNGLFVTSGKREGDTWLAEEAAWYRFSELGRFHSENYVASGALTAQIGSGDFELLAFSNSCARKFGHFANLLNKLRDGKTLSPEDFHFESNERFCPRCGSRYSDPRRRICPKCGNKNAIFLRVLGYAPKYKFALLFLVLTILASAALSLVRPVLNNKFLFDEILSPSSPYYGKLAVFLIAVLLVEATTMLVGIANGRLGARLAAKIVYDIKLELFSAMQRLSLSFYNKKHTGNLMTRINNDALDVQYFLNDGIPHFIINFISIVCIFAIMCSFRPTFALFVFLPVPFIVWIIRKVVPKFKKYKWRAWTMSSRLNSVINDALTGMRVVKAFGKEREEVGRFGKANQNLYDANLTAGRANALTFPTLSYLMTIGGLFVWGIGGWNVANGNMTFGTLMTFVSYITMIYGPLDFMVRIFDWWTNCMNAAQRIFEVIDTRQEVADSLHPVPMPHIRGAIKLSDVTFEYEPNKPVLNHIDLEIHEGEMLGLVGHSGAGKSTITNLITRLYDVTEGSITVDGVNIKEIKLCDLRSQIGMVLQDTFLFSGSIAENIAYAKPDATQEEIMEAAKLANAHEFIMKMPDGYETVIRRRRNNLSGGEKQRISIARAILINPRILILDEATASVDTETERLIQEALERLVKGRTTIAIAHRLSTLRNADRLAVIDHGKLAELGTHEELRKKKGIYYQMLQMQKEALKIRGIPEEPGMDADEH